MDAAWKVELLGGLRAVAGPREVTRFQSRQTGLLFAYLAYHRHRAHPREELIELLWPECELEAGRGRLNQAVYSLRRQLTFPGVPGSDVLQADRETLRINPELCTTDVAAFEAALTAAKEGSSADRLARLREAVGLYRGELLPGCYSDWCLTERELLAERCIQALHQLTLLLAQERDFDGALAAASRAIALDPVREESHRILMRVSATAGQLTAALQHYEAVRRILHEELHREPSTRTLQLAQEIRDHLVRGATEPAWQPARTDCPNRTELPAAGTLTLLVADLPPVPAGTEGAPAPGVSLRKLLQPVFANAETPPLTLRSDRLRAAFGRASEALRYALACRAAVAATGSGARLRLALHTAETRPSGSTLETGERSDPDEIAGVPAIEFAERLLLAAQPGQIVASETTAGLLREDSRGSPKGEVAVLDLGTYRLRASGPLERVFQLGPAGEPETFPPLRAEPGHAGYLPVAVTRFFGRAAELAELEARLRPGGRGSPSRLWMLTGPGGTGKTRLAQEVAHRMLGSYRGAVWFASLEEAVTGEQLANTLRDAMRLERFSGMSARESVVQALSLEPSLLILDNLEQIDSSGQQFVQELLQQVPDLTLLGTSRRRLGIAGEREFPLCPLPLPEAVGDPERVVQAESARLFVDRAQAARADFQVTSHNAAPVAELCRRLEGIPLALELAAARAQVLTPAQMLAQLEQRFRFLASSRPNLHPRHRSMQAALDWSFSLLTPALRTLYARLAVFRGGWTLEAVADAGLAPTEWSLDPLDALTELRESSLVQTVEVGETLRFRMLEMIRQHAVLKLQETGEAETWRDRHRDWYLARAECAEAELRGPDQARWLEWLDGEHENLRAALEWSLAQGHSARALRLAVALCRFWEVRGYLTEGRRWLERALAAAPEADPVLRARALNRAGILAREQGDLAAAGDYCSATLELYRGLGDLRGIAYMLNNLGTLERQQRDYARALELYGASLTLQRQRGDEPAAAVLLNNLGCVAQDQGDYPQAQSYHEQSLVLQRRHEDRGGIALSLNNLADVARWTGEHDTALARVRESLELFRELGDKTGAAASLHIWGEVLIDQGKPAEAGPLLRESLELFQKAQDREGVADCLDALATLAMLGGETGAQRAAMLLSASEALRESLGSPLPPNARARHTQRMEAARAVLGEPGFARAGAEGRKLSWRHAAELAVQPFTEDS